MDHVVDAVHITDVPEQQRSHDDYTTSRHSRNTHGLTALPQLIGIASGSHKRVTQCCDHVDMFTRPQGSPVLAVASKATSHIHTVDSAACTTVTSSGEDHPIRASTKHLHRNTCRDRTAPHPDEACPILTRAAGMLCVCEPRKLSWQCTQIDKSAQIPVYSTGYRLQTRDPHSSKTSAFRSSLNSELTRSNSTGATTGSTGLLSFVVDGDVRAFPIVGLHGACVIQCRHACQLWSVRAGTHPSETHQLLLSAGRPSRPAVLAGTKAGGDQVWPLLRPLR